MISKNIINTLKEVIWDSRKSEYIRPSDNYLIQPTKFMGAENKA